MILPELFFKLGQHLALTIAAVSLAAAIAFPLACVSWPYPQWRSILLFCCQVAQTVPSLALMAFLIPLLGIGLGTAIVVLVIYAALPIVRNAMTAFGETPPELLEAGRTLGMNRLQLLLYVHIPLGLPLIVAGVRTATTWSVGTATLSAFIGAGGLGDYITRGLAIQSTRLLLLGAVPAALLAVTLDAILGRIEAGTLRWKNGSSFWSA